MAHFPEVRWPLQPRPPPSSRLSGSTADPLHINCGVFIYCRTPDCPHTWPPAGTHPRSNTLMYRSRQVRSKPVLRNRRGARAPPPSRPSSNHGNGERSGRVARARVHAARFRGLSEKLPPLLPGLGGANAPPFWTLLPKSRESSLLGILLLNRHRCLAAPIRVPSTMQGTSPHLPRSLHAWHLQCLSRWG